MSAKERPFGSGLDMLIKFKAPCCVSQDGKEDNTEAKDNFHVFRWSGLPPSAHPLRNNDTLGQIKGRHLANIISKRIFSNEDVGILFKISLTFVHKGPIDNEPAILLGTEQATHHFKNQCHYIDVIMTTMASPNHQPHGCLLNRLIRRRSKKTPKFRVTGHCVGNSPGPVNSPHKGPVTRKMFPFDDVIMVHLSGLTMLLEQPMCIQQDLCSHLVHNHRPIQTMRVSVWNKSRIAISLWSWRK